MRKGEENMLEFRMKEFLIARPFFSTTQYPSSFFAKNYGRLKRKIKHNFTNSQKYQKAKLNIFGLCKKKNSYQFLRTPLLQSLRQKLKKFGRSLHICRPMNEEPALHSACHHRLLQRSVASCRRAFHNQNDISKTALSQPLLLLGVTRLFDGSLRNG